jgi:hypothetical protein
MVTRSIELAAIVAIMGMAAVRRPHAMYQVFRVESVISVTDIVRPLDQFLPNIKIFIIETGFYF